MHSKQHTVSIYSVLLAVFFLANSLPGQKPTNQSATEQGGLSQLSQPLEELAQRVGPSVVQVFATSFSPIEAESF